MRVMLSSRGLLSLLMISLLAYPLLGVGTTGTIVGIVTDAKGGVIAQAKATIKNAGTNATRDVTTNANGEYSVPLLPPGVYEISVEHTGFRRAVVSGIKLEVDQTARVDIVLQVGAVSEQVTVTETEPLLQTDTSTVGQVIDLQKVSQLPLNERNFLAFTLLVPGAQLPSDGSQNSTQGGSISVNGAREQANNFLLDGVDNNDLAINQYTVLPSVDAIEEFKVQSSNSSAEFGRSAGAQINVVTKSGTNQFHGTAFEFFRNRNLDAKNFFDRPDCTPTSAPGSCAGIPGLDRNQYGATAGGPIRKNKTFFFGSYEGLNLRQAATRQATVPSQAQRQQALADVPNPNAAGLAVFNLLPAANVGTDLLNSNSFVSSPIIRNKVYQVIGKVDHRINDANLLSGEYAIFNEHRFNPFDPLAPFTNLPGNGSFTLNRGQIVRIEETHTFSTRLLNDARFGFNRSRGGIFQQHNGTNLNQQLGFPTILPGTLDLGVPAVQIAGFDGVGEPENLPQDRRDNTFHYSDVLAWNPSFNGGRHQFKFGADIRRFQLNFFLDEIARGQWSFLGGVSNPTKPSSALDDLLSGTPALAITTAGNTQTELRTTQMDYFAQDDVRLNSHLTLNLGLRWEYNSPVADNHNRLSVPDLTGNALTCNPKPNCQFIIAGTNGVPRATYDPTYTNFAPRIGFAWKPTASDKLIVRSGYGIFYDSGILNGNILPRFNPPFFTVLLFFNNNTATTPGNLNVGNIVTQTGAPPQAAPSMIARNYRDGYAQQWNLDLQFEPLKNLVLDAGYVGSKGTHLQDTRNFDQGAPGSAPNGVSTNLPFPAYGNITLIQSAASSIYHAFQFRAEKRFSQGLSFLSSYTFSRSIDDGSAEFGTKAETGIPQDSNNLAAERGLSNFNTKHRFVFNSVYEIPIGKGKQWLNREGLVDYLLGHWQAGGILTLQSGRPFTVNRGIDQSQSGSFSLQSSPTAADRPNLVGNPFQGGNMAGQTGCPARVQTPQHWLNPCAFAAPAGAAFGNLGRNTLVGPNFRDVDFSLAKDIPLSSEFRKLQFRAEMFNIFNHPNFDLPNPNFDAGSTFGQVQSANAFGGKPPRQIQLGLKFIF
jgi:Carboxypeptidase regulatory-like domain/TonB dependent receptor/TonB-dependent Receptor Plug Domain